MNNFKETLKQLTEINTKCIVNFHNQSIVIIDKLEIPTIKPNPNWFSVGDTVFYFTDIRAITITPKITKITLKSEVWNRWQKNKLPHPKRI